MKIPLRLSGLTSAQSLARLVSSSDTAGSAHTVAVQMEGSRVDAMMVFMFHVLIGKSSSHFGIVCCFRVAGLTLPSGAV